MEIGGFCNEMSKGASAKAKFLSNPKVLGHFQCTNTFGILGRKGGGGLTKSRICLALFAQILGKLGRAKVAQKVNIFEGDATLQPS